MAVLSTLLHVLLIIGKVLLIIILAVLALLLLLLLAPYCYKAQIKADREHFRADGGVSWLGFVARVRFHLMDEEKDFEIYLLGIPVLRLLRSFKNRKNRSGEKQNESAAAGSGTNVTQPECAESTEESGETQPEGTESTGEAEKTQPEQEVADAQKNPPQELAGAQKRLTQEQKEQAGAQERLTQEQTDQTGTKRQSPAEQKAEAKRQREAAREQKKAARAQKREARKNAHRQEKAGSGSGRESSAGKIRSILGKVRWGMQLIHTEMFQEAFAAAKTGGIRVLKHILPRRISGFIRFGLSDPARTGQISGILAMLYPKMPEKLEVIPDFQEACFEADTVFKGHVFLIYIIIQGLKIILNKNVRLLIKVVRQKVPLEKVIAAENRRSGGNRNGK